MVYILYLHILLLLEYSNIHYLITDDISSPSVSMFRSGQNNNSVFVNNFIPKQTQSKYSLFHYIFCLVPSGKPECLATHSKSVSDTTDVPPNKDYISNEQQ